MYTLLLRLTKTKKTNAVTLENMYQSECLHISSRLLPLHTQNSQKSARSSDWTIQIQLSHWHSKILIILNVYQSHPGVCRFIHIILKSLPVILKSQLAPQLTKENDYVSDFWECSSIPSRRLPLHTHSFQKITCDSQKSHFILKILHFILKSQLAP